MKQSLKDEITSVLYSASIVDNLARKTFISLFVLSLLQTRKVQFNKLATVLNDEVKSTSNQNSIEDFFREITLDFQALARLVVAPLPKKAELRLTIDRTDRTADAVEFWQMPSEHLDGFGKMWRPATTTLLGITGQQEREF